MILVERSARVVAPIEAVWDIVQRVERLPAWLDRVREAEVLSGEGFGRRLRVQPGRGAAVDAEVIAYQEPTLIGWRERQKGAGARAEARTEVYVQLAVDGDDTAVRLILVRWPDGPFRKALHRWNARRVGAELEGSLRRLGDLSVPGGSEQPDEPPSAAELRLADLLNPPAEPDREEPEPEPEPEPPAREPVAAGTGATVTARGVAKARLKC